MPRAPCGGLPSGAIFNPFQGGEGCNTGPHVPSNPMLGPNDPPAKGKTHGGSAPIVMGPQAGPHSIHSRGGRGAVRAPMCPLTPCMTPLHHVPRTRRTEGARPLSWAPKRTMGLVSLACRSMDAGWEFDYLGWLERGGGLGVAMIGC